MPFLTAIENSPIKRTHTSAFLKILNLIYKIM